MILLHIILNLCSSAPGQSYLHSMTDMATAARDSGHPIGAACHEVSFLFLFIPTGRLVQVQLYTVVGHNL